MNHKELDAWKQGMVLVEEIYAATALFPKVEVFGLVSQMRRAAISVPSNISEGAARRSKKEFVNFLSVTLGSLAELETQTLISERLGYCSGPNLLERITRVRALVIGLRNSLMPSRMG